MKIFVSGQITDIDNVRKAQEEFIKAGHTLTHDWTRNESGDKMLAGPKDKLRNPAETKRRAQLDIQGVINCDAYVICTDNEAPGKGMYVELGAALALSETRGKPRVYLVGKMNHMSVFYFHPKIIRLSSIQEIVERLSES